MYSVKPYTYRGKEFKIHVLGNNGDNHCIVVPFQWKEVYEGRQSYGSIEDAIKAIAKIEDAQK